MRIFNSVFKRLLVVSFSISTLGCWSDETPADIFDDYLTRVARVQNEKPLNGEFEFDNLPRKRELFLTIPSVSLGLLDSYQLRQCGLFNLIAEKNSVLGKVADEFRNYDYQVALLEGIGKCLASSDLNVDVYKLLESIEQQKIAQFPKHQWNLIFASQAMQTQLRSRQWLPKGTSAQVNDVADALRYLEHSLEAPLSTIPVVKIQEVLEKQPVLGDLRYSLANAAFQLTQITEQLERYDHKILCGKQRDLTRFRHLNNVFEQQFVARVQPYMAQLDGYYQQVSSRLSIFKPQPTLHPYVFPLEESHKAFRLATLQHVDYWKQLFQRCGRKLG